jgi:hypothetical protein
MVRTMEEVSLTFALPTKSGAFPGRYPRFRLGSGDAGTPARAVET